MTVLMDTSFSPGSNEFSRLVAGEYLSFFDFSGLSLDRALRSVGRIGKGWGGGRDTLHSWASWTVSILGSVGQSLVPLGRLRKGSPEWAVGWLGTEGRRAKCLVSTSCVHQSDSPTNLGCSQDSPPLLKGEVGGEFDLRAYGYLDREVRRGPIGFEG